MNIKSKHAIGVSLVSRGLALWLLTFGTAVADEADAIRLSDPVEVTEAYETFGQPLPPAEVTMTLAEAMLAAADLAEQEVQISTKVKQVCQKKGCFFVAQQGNALVRVSFKDYGFFVPTNISGRTVTLHGVIREHALSAERAEHYSEDASEPGAFKPGLQYEIVATSVRVPRG